MDYLKEIHIIMGLVHFLLIIFIVKFSFRIINTFLIIHNYYFYKLILRIRQITKLIVS